jgi:hypothetical protein
MVDYNRPAAMPHAAHSGLNREILNISNLRNLKMHEPGFILYSQKLYGG